METSRLAHPLPAPRHPQESAPPAPALPAPPAPATAAPPAGLGTWVATILVCLVAGASPIIGFLSFAH